jgi:prepilin-type N-terminal cleavage/methylation domain-containing protein
LSVVSCQWPWARRGGLRLGFTLIELLVVITIILIISAVALPVVIPALSHRQVSEAARILQGALVGARDSALHNGTPSGIRLLPDPAFPVQYHSVTINGITTTQIDATLPFASNRIIPIEAAPEYSEGTVSVYGPNLYPAAIRTVNGASGPLSGVPCLVIEESPGDWVHNGNAWTYVPHSPTGWYWNIRVGDKLQINDSGLWYTVVGPMVIAPGGGNSEAFVNVGQPATPSPWSHTILAPDGTRQNIQPEFLLLVNGRDDNANGWVDEGFDFVDNDGDGFVDNSFAEWETEAWPSSFDPFDAAGVSPKAPFNLAYTIQRRPAPVANAREISLPTNVVIDMTTWGFPTPANASLERSRLPVDPFTGYVDILLYPNGTVVPTTAYSTPAAFGMSGAFFQFWLAERSDVFAPNQNSLNANTPPYLPLPQGQAPGLFSGRAEIKGEYRLITLFSRTGQITTLDNVPFDSTGKISLGTYNVNIPFLQARQGARGAQ